MRNLSAADQRLALAGRMMAAVGAAPVANRPVPQPAAAADDSSAGLSEAERKLSGALMRVNHVGEVCAQALYEGQALSTRDEALRKEFRQAAEEEGDHLSWTRERLRELNDRPSLLNPLWYAGSLLIGIAAGRLGDRVSLGFMAETERQVEAHLDGHLERLPQGDLASRAIVSAMKADEVRHAEKAIASGGAPIPAPVSAAMRLASRLMTRTAHYL